MEDLAEGIGQWRAPEPGFIGKVSQINVDLAGRQSGSCRKMSETLTTVVEMLSIGAVCGDRERWLEEAMN